MRVSLKNICMGVLASCSLVACDLDTTPTTSLETNAVFKNLDNAKAVLAGTWNYVFTSGSTSEAPTWCVRQATVSPPATA